MKKNEKNEPAPALKKKVLATVNLIKTQLEKNGISVTGYKIVFDGEFFRITIRTPEGTRFARFVESIFIEEDEMTTAIKEYIINTLINKLMQLNKT